MTRIAVLDDYQGVAQSYADWTSLPEGSDVQFFADHISDAARVSERLAAFEVLVGSPERATTEGVCVL